MAYCSHYTADSHSGLFPDLCNPCFGNLPDNSNLITYYPTGCRSDRKNMEFLDYYVRDFVMNVLPDIYVKRITIGKTIPKPNINSHPFCYPAIKLVSTNLRRIEAIGILQMFRYPFEWLEFEKRFVEEMKKGYTPTDAWIFAHTLDNPDHGLLNYNSLMRRNEYRANELGTYDLKKRFEALSKGGNLFRNFRLEV